MITFIHVSVKLRFGALGYVLRTWLKCHGMGQETGCKQQFNQIKMDVNVMEFFV